MNNNNKFLPAQNEVTKLLGRSNVLCDEAALALNSFDGSPVKIRPDAVLNIPNAAVLPDIIKILNKFNVPFTPRTAATNHDGGCVAVKGGCILNLSALDKIILIDTKAKYAIVECGVVNKNLQDALEPLGFFYAPDPASQAFCTIGGNAALNAGGPKTLKYGATAANILKAEFITPEGETLLLDRSADGPDLLSLLVKSEGTLGVITKLWVKITPKQPALKTVLAYFPTLKDTMQAVKEITAAGILPSALEAMDKTTMDVTQTSYPDGMQAMLIVETDGKKQAVEKEAKQILDICLKNNAIKTESSSKEAERAKLWRQRKSAASALAKLAPNLVSLDGMVPRANLPQAIESVRAVFDKYGIRGGMVFHAGDGNMHPNIVFDERNLFETAQVKKAVKEVNAAAVAAGGTISGEHGVGVEKRAAMTLMFEAPVLDLFKKIKTEFDPKNISNPDKILPVASQSRLSATLPQDEQTIKIIESVKQAYAAKTPVNIVGLKTKYRPKDGSVLDLSSLNKITEIDTENLLLTVQSGVSVKAAAEELLKQNMFLPFPSCKGSMGGVYASKTFQDIADYITAVEFVLPDGTFIRLGGKYIKNAAGYDIIRLLSGSQGFYAAITSLTIRVFTVKPSAQPQRDFSVFTPTKESLRLKKVFDAHNIFNPFIIREQDNGAR